MALQLTSSNNIHFVDPCAISYVSFPGTAMSVLSCRRSEDAAEMRQQCEGCEMNAWSSNEGNGLDWNDRKETDARQCHKNNINSNSNR